MSTSGGATWKELDKSMDDGYAIAAGLQLYQAGCAVDQLSAVRGMGVFKSKDDGKTWQKVMLSKEYGCVKAIAIHPRNKQFIFAGGQSLGNRSMASKLYESTNAGSTWSEVKALTGKGSCVNGICIDPAEPNRVLAALDKGVFVSEDNGKTWGTPGQTIPATCIVGDPGIKGRFFAGSSEGAWMSTNGGRSWKEINENIPSRSLLCLAFDGTHSVLYAGGMSGGVMRLKLGSVQIPVGTH